MPATVVAPGDVLGARYRLADVIGIGGMATVHRARDEATARPVAVKVFPPTSTPDDQERQRFEVAMLAHLDHPGLVSLLDAGTAGEGVASQTYIVMELVPGPTLADVLRAGALSRRQAAGVGAQLADALVAVHEAGVVHRDVKPANVLVADARWSPDTAEAPPVKLADFGIARLVDAARLTVTGVTLGTASYLSPEQATGGAVGPPADVYALGLVVLECVTGRKAFTGTVAEVAAARLSVDPSVPDELGEQWCSLLRGMTRRDPADRVPMAEAARRLAALAAPPVPGGAGPTTAGRAHRGAAHRAGRSGRARRVAVAGVVGITAAAAGFGAAAALRPESAPRTAVTAPSGVDGALGDALAELAESVRP